VLDYVIPYVKEREAFGEPIARRQSVAFMCANIAIELDGLRLVTWRGASRRAAGLPFARERRWPGCTDKGMQIGLDGVQLLGGHGYTRNTRSSAGTAICGPSASPRVSWSQQASEEGEPKWQSIWNCREAGSRGREGAPGRAEIFRPISRKYDLTARLPGRARHLATCSRDPEANTGGPFAGHRRVPRRADGQGKRQRRQHVRLLNALRDLLGRRRHAAVGALPGPGQRRDLRVATDEQLERLGKVWAAMAITEPVRLGLLGGDHDHLDGDEYVINGEKIFVTAGSRATHIVVWATLDKSKGRAAIKSFIAR
jgi:alkylation response protein AidB-like acyl-CoA dehydrogenase